MLYYAILCSRVCYTGYTMLSYVLVCYTMFIMVIVPYSSNWYWFFEIIIPGSHRSSTGLVLGALSPALRLLRWSPRFFGLFWSITLAYYTPVIYGIPVLYGLCNVPFYAIWPDFWTIVDPMFFPLHKLWVSVTNTNSRQCTRPWLSWSSCSQRMSWLSHA